MNYRALFVGIILFSNTIVAQADRKATDVNVVNTRPIPVEAVNTVKTQESSIDVGNLVVYTADLNGGIVGNFGIHLPVKMRVESVELNPNRDSSIGGDNPGYLEKGDYSCLVKLGITSPYLHTASSQDTSQPRFTTFHWDMNTSLREPIRYVFPTPIILPADVKAFAYDSFWISDVVGLSNVRCDAYITVVGTAVE